MVHASQSLLERCTPYPSHDFFHLVMACDPDCLVQVNTWISPLKPKGQVVL